MRKLTAILLLLGIFTALAACNPVRKSGNTTDTTAPGGGGATSATPADSTDPIKLGFNFEETGNAATFGQSSRKGAELAIKEINDAGGVLGRQFQGIFEDNASDSAQSATVVSKLINQDQVDVVIGAVASSNSLAAARVAEDAGVPMVTPASTNPAVTVTDGGQVREWIFRTCFTDDFQGEAIADFVVNGEIKGNKAIVFYDADNDYSIGIYETIMREAPGLNLEIVAEDSFLSTSETDYRSKLNRFKTLDFDALIVPGYYNQVGQIANQAREVGITQPLIGGDGWDSPDLWQTAGQNIEGSYFTNHYSADDEDPAVQQFISSYKAAHGGQVPDAMAILAYDGVKVVADAIERAGRTDKAAVREALAKTANFPGAAGSITIDDQHNATKKLVVLKIGDGGDLSWAYTYDPTAGGGGSAVQHERPAPPADV